MGKLYTTFLLFTCLVFTAFSQNVHVDFYDGKIYLRTEKLLPEIDAVKDRISIKDAFFLSETQITEYGIQSIKKPFYRTTDKSIRTIYLIEFSQHHKIYDLLAELNKSEKIDYAEQVPIYKTILNPNDLGPNNFTVNQGGQYSLHKVQAPAAWDISVGSSTIKVAVVDDAVYALHPDLGPALWVNAGEIPGNGIDDDNNGYIDDINGYDVANDDNDVNPNLIGMKHGTHVAGIVGAKTDNGIGMASIGFGVSIMAVKASDQQQYITDGYAGITYAADAGADVINMSWGGNGGGSTGQNIVNYAFNKGCILVAAAGNDNVTTQFYPAAYNNVISVASTDINDNRSSFSNYGSWIDISSPGTAIYSTYTGGSTLAAITAAYANNSGTSMASPMVAGMVGLMLSKNPNLTPTQIYNCLYSTADPVNTNASQMGAGRFNAFAAMQCVANTLQQKPIGIVNSSETEGCLGASFTFNAGSVGGPTTTYSWSFPGGTPATSTLQNPTVTYNSTGNFNVTLISSNTYGSDTLVLTNYITISNVATQTLFAENFEGTTVNMTTVNPDNGITWSVLGTGGNTSGAQSAYLNLYNYNTVGQRDGLVTPSIDFSNSSNSNLTFKHAYKRYPNNATDSLIIYVSTNGGTNWSRVWARGDNGQGSFATVTSGSAAFTPAQASDWCFAGSYGPPCFTVNLSAYDGQPNVRIKFESYNAYGNNLFLDDIKVEGVCANGLPAPPLPEYSASASTICEGATVNFTNQTQNATSYLWTFPGGTPATSTATNPSVVFNNAGVYNVQLEATNTGGTNIALSNVTITVNPNPVVNVTLSNGVLTATAPGATNYQWYLNNAFITGANQPNYVPTISGVYKVRVTNSYGCSVMSSIVEVIVDNSMSNDVYSLGDWEIFPNPTNDVLNIKWKHVEVEKLQIIDTYGRVISNIKMDQGMNVSIIHTAHLAEGVYFIKAIGKTVDIPMKRFIVKH